MFSISITIITAQVRYKASLISSEQYLFTCMRYIELNPVRAGMVEAPGCRYTMMQRLGIFHFSVTFFMMQFGMLCWNTKVYKLCYI